VEEGGRAGCPTYPTDPGDEKSMTYLKTRFDRLTVLSKVEGQNSCIPVGMNHTVHTVGRAPSSPRGSPLGARLSAKPREAEGSRGRSHWPCKTTFSAVSISSNFQGE